jgi:hypothetical protein
MIQKVLTYAYIFLGIASFCYWVSALLCVCRMLKHKKPELSLFKVATTGVFREDNFTVEGNHQRNNLKAAMIKFAMVVAGMVIIVFIGVQTQS